MRRAVGIAASLLLLGATPESKPKIAAIEVRFFDPEKGDFTGDVLNKEGLYAGWNTFLREGNGGVVRGDALVLVKVELPDWSNRSFVIDGPLTITARNGKKVVAHRVFTRIDLLDSKIVSRALYLPDIGCTGEIVISAALAGQTKKARMIMSCGE
jgi:hypothetical protein